jgi:hypothetical protein
MFRNCCYCTKIPQAKVEKDDELKAYLNKFYDELKKDPVSKKELFKILVEVEENYHFKSNDGKVNEKLKKILMEEMGEKIVKFNS